MCETERKHTIYMFEQCVANDQIKKKIITIRFR